MNQSFTACICRCHSPVFIGVLAQLGKKFERGCKVILQGNTRNCSETEEDKNIRNMLHKSELLV